MNLSAERPGDTLGRTVNAFYRSIFLRLFLQEAIMFFAAAFFLAGGGVLIWRLALPEGLQLKNSIPELTGWSWWPEKLDWTRLAAGAVCIVLFLCAVLGALFRAKRRTPPKKKLTVWLDAHSNGGGLFAASLETDCSEWLDRVPPPRPASPVMAFPIALLLALLAAILFFAADVFMFDSETLAGPARLDVHREKKEIESKLNILEQEPLIPKDELAEAKEKTEKLVENSSGVAPARTLEEINALRKLSDELAAKASRSMERSEENFERLSQTASALSNQSPDVPGRSKALEQFKQLAEQLAADDPALAEALKQSGDNLASSMTPEQLQAFADAMANNAQDMRERIEKLAQARNNQMQQQGGGQGGQQGGQQGGGQSDTGFADESDYERSAEQLRQWLEENAPGADELTDAAGQSPGQGQQSGIAGSGGIQRGRGDAALNYTGRTEELGDERRDVVLNNDLPGQSVTIQQFRTAPGEETAERAKAGHLSGSGQAAEHAETRILPSHRESVRRYFNNAQNQP